MYRLIERLGAVKKEASTNSQNIMPPTSTMKKDLSKSFSEMVQQVGNNKQSRDNFSRDSRVRERMLVLAELGDADITVIVNTEMEDTYRLYVCKDVRCNVILVKEKRSNNAEFFKTCRLKMKHINVSVVGNDVNYKRERL